MRVSYEILFAALLGTCALGCGGGDSGGSTGAAGRGGTAGSDGGVGATANTGGAGGVGGVGGAAGASVGGSAGMAGMAGAAGAGATGGVGGLPFSYERPDVGVALSSTELSDATDRYLELLDGTRWIDFVDERAHGWPKSDPQGRYWFGTWWSGVTVVKQGGQVTYEHGDNGADNNGLRTAHVLEGACFAHLVWGLPVAERVTHKVLRGFTSWILSMERQPNDAAAPLLGRAHYPASIQSDDGPSYFIDYDRNHPGNDNGATEYVRVPLNPHWGDIWIKNKRSKDDIGHMARAIGLLDACDGTFGSSEAQADLVQMRDLYATWARKVEDEGWKIATLDKSGNVWQPPDLLANFVTLGNAECDAVLALRLMGRGDPGMFDCGNGIVPLEAAIVGSNDQNGEIFRSFHEAAVVHALRSRQNTVARALLDGLALRIEEGIDGFESGNPPAFLTDRDFADLLLLSASLGVPLTSREVRWVHGQIDIARTEYLDSKNDRIYNVFDASTPDGAYSFQPGQAGIHFKSLALALGSCASPYANPAARPLLDCARVRAAR